MRKMIEVIGKEWKEIIYNINFAIAIVLVTISNMLYQISYESEGLIKQDTVLAIFFFKDLEHIALKNIDMSSEAILAQFIYSDWFSMLLIMLCSFPVVSIFVEEYNSGLFFTKISRTTICKYSILKYITAVLSGMNVFLIGYLLFKIIIESRFPKIAEYDDGIKGNIFLNQGNESTFIFHVMIVSAIFVAIVMIMATYIKDRYLLFGLPMLFIFFTGRLSMYVGKLHFELYEEGKGWWNFLILQNYVGLYYSFSWNTKQEYVYFYFIALFELLLLFIWFYKRIERRIIGNV